MPAEERIIASADGTPIWADAVGDPTKPAIVFIHGLACSALGFDKQVSDPDLLSNHYLVRYEMRGHARSGMPENVEAYASLRHAQDFRAVCEAFDLKRPFMFGWSLGACIAVDIATHLGVDYISGVIYCGGPVLALEICGPTIPSAFATVVPTIMSTDANVTAKSAAVFAESCVANPDVVLPWSTKLQWMGGLGIQPPLIRNHSMSREQDTKKWREEAKQWPVLLIHGDLDAHCIPEVVINQAKEVYTDLDVRMMEGVGHSPHFERPTEVNSFVRSFVDRVHGSKA